MLLFLTAALILQLILFHLDEYYFHRKRGLSRPEIVSALMDGFFYLLPLAIAIFCSFTIFWQWIYIFLAILSCLSVVKNEWFYPVVMDRNEKLVHAGLYLLHPILLYTFYLSWDQDFFNNSMGFWMVQLTYLGLGLRTLAHQLIYWNYIYDKTAYSKEP